LAALFCTHGTDSTRLSRKGVSTPLLLMWQSIATPRPIKLSETEETVPGPPIHLRGCTR
jgi:hypothetical protein